MNTEKFVIVRNMYLPSRMAVRYGTPQFLLKSTVRWYGTPFFVKVQVRYAFFVKVRVRYAFFVKVRVRYVGTLFELKTQDFSHIAPAFCIQRQNTAETDSKCVN